MSLTTRVLVALILGLAAGLIVLAHPTPILVKMVSIVEPIGTLWVNGIRMTVIPLVVSLLITAIASSSNMRVVRGIGLRALASFLGLLVFAAVAGLVIVPPMFHWLHLNAAAFSTLRPSGGITTTPSIPSIAEWVVGVVPTNPVKAASDGTLLPLVVFVLAFALALLTIPQDRRDSVVLFFGAVGDAMLAIVRVVIDLAPIGVSSLLMLPIASPNGNSSGGRVGILRRRDRNCSESFRIASLSRGGLCGSSFDASVRASGVSGSGCRIQFEFLSCLASRTDRRRRTAIEPPAEHGRRSTVTSGLNVQNRNTGAQPCGGNVSLPPLRSDAWFTATRRGRIDVHRNELQHTGSAAWMAACYCTCRSVNGDSGGGNRTLDCCGRHPGRFRYNPERNGRSGGRGHRFAKPHRREMKQRQVASERAAC